MATALENVNNDFLGKISEGLEAIIGLQSVYITVKDMLYLRQGKKYSDAKEIFNLIDLQALIIELNEIEFDYKMNTVSAFALSFDSGNNEMFYRSLNSNNYILSVNRLLQKIIDTILFLAETLKLSITTKTNTDELMSKLTIIKSKLVSSARVNIICGPEQDAFEYCCDTKMEVLPETSEMRCSICKRLRGITGAVFRDEQFYPQEGQKNKHGGYDTSRHYKFWMTRLQGVETITLKDDLVKRIEYIITRDKYDKKRLTCEQMRSILKDSKVFATNLNDHVPSLIKYFGGLPPPILDYQEYKQVSIKFSKLMHLYDQVNPDGGNKPYYPYFIYKIIEQDFKHNPEKIRLLNYIHLQSRDTVIKNDIHYERMCRIAPKEDNFIYTPTDPVIGFK